MLQKVIEKKKKKVQPVFNVKDLTRDQLNNLGPNYQKVYRIFQCDIQIFKEINGLKKKI